MVVIAHKSIREYSAKHPQAAPALTRWYHETIAAHWSNISDVRTTFRSADYIGNDRVVFDIGGNKFRLIAVILYDIRTVYIKFIGTHEEYDKVDVLIVNNY
jgi:mRNA interferase HigB